MNVVLDLQLACENQQGLPAESDFQRWLDGTINGFQDEAEVTVRLVDEAESNELNLTYRGKDKPTNVLSFPAEMPGMLGDIVLALGVVKREARQAGRRTADHFAHLVAHGTLHLAGHDHLVAGEAQRMERAEARIMRRLGRPNPWRGVQ